eukprot:3483176-Pleurochrysis_carterae.AAC.1
MSWCERVCTPSVCNNTAAELARGRAYARDAQARARMRAFGRIASTCALRLGGRRGRHEALGQTGMWGYKA